MCVSTAWTEVWFLLSGNVTMFDEFTEIFINIYNKITDKIMIPMINWKVSLQRHMVSPMVRFVVNRLTHVTITIVWFVYKIILSFISYNITLGIYF